MSLAIFDLDNTLIAGDSDHLWGQYLIKKGVVDREYYERENNRYYDEYKQGTLDIYAFLRFSLKPLTQHPLPTLLSWRAEFMRDEIDSLMLPKAITLLNKHRASGDTLLIITATNRFVTEPIADKLGVEHLLATDPEQINGQYTGEVAGSPCFQEGKVERLAQWLAEQGGDLKGSYFYSDSHNDIPLLKKVEHPCVVDGDEQLLEYARKKAWPTMSLR